MIYWWIRSPHLHTLHPGFYMVCRIGAIGCWRTCKGCFTTHGVILFSFTPFFDFRLLAPWDGSRLRAWLFTPASNFRFLAHIKSSSNGLQAHLQGAAHDPRVILAAASLTIRGFSHFFLALDLKMRFFFDALLIIGPSRLRLRLCLGLGFWLRGDPID